MLRRYIENKNGRNISLLDDKNGRNRTFKSGFIDSSYVYDSRGHHKKYFSGETFPEGLKVEGVLDRLEECLK